MLVRAVWTVAFHSILTDESKICSQTFCCDKTLVALWQMLQAHSTWCPELGSANSNIQQGQADEPKKQLPWS